jgi:L-ascorbate metabolism protein UlaG (beta-lactamase superfamily)
MVSVRFLGHACFSLSDGKFTVLFDPFLDGNPDAAMTASEVTADALLVSHGHSDHLGDAIPISKRTGALIVAPYELAMYCQRNGAKVHPLHIGGARQFEFGWVKLVMATHGSAVVSENLIEYTGPPCGFVVKMADKTLYYAGDTGLFGDMGLIGDLHRPQVAILPIGDNFTMGIEDAVEAAKLVRPDVVIPMHYNAYDVIKQDPNRFAKLVEAEDINCVILKPGEVFEIKD